MKFRLIVSFIAVSVLFGTLIVISNLYFQPAAEKIDYSKGLSDQGTQSRFMTERDKYLKLVEVEGVPKTLKILRSAMKEDAFVSSYCHEIAHEIGRIAYETRESVGAVLQNGDDVCASGFLHGLFEGIFASEGNVASTSEYLGSECIKLPDVMSERGQCFHGIGHGLMYALDNELPESLRLCGKFEDRTGVDCRSGAYMENFNSDLHLHPSEYLSKTDFFYPCGEQAEGLKSTCYLYAPIYFLNAHEMDFGGALLWCKEAPLEFQENCFIGVGYQIARRNAHDPTVSEALCRKAEEKWANTCLWGVVIMHLTINDIKTREEALKMCEGMDPDSQLTCAFFVENLGKELLDA